MFFSQAYTAFAHELAVIMLSISCNIFVCTEDLFNAPYGVAMDAEGSASSAVEVVSYRVHLEIAEEHPPALIPKAIRALLSWQ